MRISKREVNMLIGLLGILIAFCAYYFGYLNINEKTEVLEAENAQMEAEIRVYETWLDKKDAYVTDIEEMQKSIADWVNEFPANALPEDDMKWAYELDNRNPGDYLFIHSMSFTEPGLVYTTNYETDSKEGTEATMIAGSGGIQYPAYSLYRYSVGMGVECSYRGMKNMVARIYSESDRKTIESLVLNYDDSTGQLSGNVMINTYFLLGTDKGYAQPDLTPVRQGTDNIFGALEITGDDALEETEGNAE